jgi:hypothetical protein
MSVSAGAGNSDGTSSSVVVPAVSATSSAAGSISDSSVVSAATFVAPASTLAAAVEVAVGVEEEAVALLAAAAVFSVALEGNGGLLTQRREIEPSEPPVNTAPCATQTLRIRTLALCGAHSTTCVDSSTLLD